MSTTAWIAATMSVAGFWLAAAGVAHAQSGFGCPPRSGQLIEITVGDIDCDTASGFAAH